MVFERFSAAAFQTVTLASQEALRLRHDRIGTEHFCGVSLANLAVYPPESS